MSELTDEETEMSIAVNDLIDKTFALLKENGADTEIAHRVLSLGQIILNLRVKKSSEVFHDDCQWMVNFYRAQYESGEMSNG